MHIVFHKQDIEALQRSFELDETLRSEIVCLNDDFSLGPLKYNDPLEELQWRKEWWKEVLEEEISLSDPEGINNQLLIHNLRKKMEAAPEERLLMWIAPNVRDVCGYYRLLQDLKQFSGRVEVIHLNNLPFINEKGSIFYPEYLSEIPAREFVKAKKLAREITEAEFELDSEEWEHICKQNKAVRKLEGAKKISSHEDDVFDKELLQSAGTEFSKAGRVVSRYLSKSKSRISSAFLLWRLRQLASKGRLISGEIRNAKEFDIKMASGERVEQ